MTMMKNRGCGGWRLHWRAFVMLAFIPLLYTIIFGGLFSPHVLTQVPVGICNLDGGQQGRVLVREMAQVPEISLIRETVTKEELDKALEAGEIYGAIVIPPDFSEGIKSKHPVNVQLYVRNANTAIGGVILAAVQGVIGVYSVQVAVQNYIGARFPPGQAGAAASQINLSPRILYNSTGSYEDFFLTVLMLHALQIAMVFVLAPMFTMERLRGEAPGTKSVVLYLLRRICLFGIFGALVMSACIGYSYSFFGIAVRGNGLTLCGAVFCFAACMTAFSLMVGAWAPNPVSSITYPLFYIMPSVLFSDAVWPRASMDALSRFLTFVMPIGYMGNDFRDLLVRGNSPGLLADCASLLILGVLFFAFAAWGLKRYEAKPEGGEKGEDSHVAVDCA